MADKAISELVAAPSVTPDSLFVLQQDGTAKKLTAQVLENWLLSFANGHGGIQSCELLKTEGLVKTYRFTLADQTSIDIDVVDGRGIESVKPTSTNGLVVTYTITYNDGKTDTITVTNGAKGDKGDRADIWVKYASQKPTASSHSFGDVADSWIGIATGHNMAAAPTDWRQYTWFQWKGEKGDTGEPATMVSSQVTYQVGDSGTIIPSGSWTTTVPSVTPGKFLWTRQVLQFNTGDPITSYSVTRFGIDGSGSVSTVAGVAPDENGNVPLDASSVKALPIGGGTMEGAINMNGQPIRGLNMPTEDSQAVNKEYADKTRSIAQGGTDATNAKDAREKLGITPQNIGALGAEESKDYPGCYYRMVGDETEWLNPPMVDGVEYRTAERMNGFIVYAKLLSFGAIDGNNTKTVAFSNEGNAIGIRVTANAAQGTTRASFPITAAANDFVSLYLSNQNVAITNVGDHWSGYSVTAIVHYIKI